jgi:site-specific recombinase XerD
LLNRARFLEAVPGLRSRAALATAYGAGLRVSEVAALKIGDLDSSRRPRQRGRALQEPTYAPSARDVSAWQLRPK